MPSNDVNITGVQRVQIGMVYEALARMLPVEGRDYSIKISFDPNKRLMIEMDGITPIGKIWVDHCRSDLPKVLGGTVNRKDNEGDARRQTDLDAGSVPVP